MGLFRSLLAHLRRQHDSRVYLLILPAAVLLLGVDGVLASTWGELILVLPVVVGVALTLRKVLYDHVDMTEAVKTAMRSPIGAGLVVLSVSLVTAVTIISGVLWLRG